MPSSVMIVFTPIEEIKTNMDFGEQIHGLFLNLVNKVDPVLAQEMHERLNFKPFTCSSILNKKRNDTLLPGRNYRFRYTVIDPELEMRMMEFLFYHCVEKIQLSKAKILVKEIVGTEGSDDLVTKKTYSDLYEISKQREFILDYISPTTLRVHSRNYPLPDPKGLFKRYLYKWNSYSSHPFPEDIILILDKILAISRHNIRSEIYKFSNSLQIGFVGRVHFKVFSKDQELIKMINTLARFSYYTGSGYKTTMGMGQTLYKEV